MWRPQYPPRDARVAELTIASLTVNLQRPGSSPRDVPPSVPVNVVHVFELRAPAGQPRVEWVLLTSEPIATRRDMERIVDGYRARWTFEEYFKAVKTGCAYEARQLESFHALSNLLAYTLVTAYALLLMRTLARTVRQLPADAIVSASELAVLRRIHRSLPQAPSAREALLAIAALGGHVQNNGDPGWQVLSRGWKRLRDCAAGYELCRNL